MTDDQTERNPADRPAWAGKLAMSDAELAIRMAYERPAPTAAPRPAPKTIDSLEDDCATFYAIFVRARTRLQQAERMLAAAIQAGRK